MIEVVHLTNRWGRKFVACIHTDSNLASVSPSGATYAQKYACGLEPAFFTPMPVVYDPVVEMHHCSRIFVYAMRVFLHD